MPQEQSVDVEGAERLKIQGNEFYVKKDYGAAHRKYTEAIKKDPKNPALYANRAATLLALKKYVDAAWDCEKAVELDPAYAKAWGRLGTATHAMAAWEKSRYAWQKALDCLPKENLSPEEQKLKIQFEEGLNKAEVARKKIESNIASISAADMQSGRMPWQRAAALRSEKKAAQISSCTFVIDYAYEDLKDGMKGLAETKVMATDPDGRELLYGRTNVIECLANAILTDPRIFTANSPDFSDKVMRQCMFENETLRGWADSGGPAIVKKEAAERLRSEGWDKLRMSLSVTVRAWIFNGFFRSGLLSHHDFAHEMYANALDILDWGRKRWPNVPREVRGSIFEKSFVRGVKRLQLQAMHGSFVRKESRFTLQDLYNAAEDLVVDVGTDESPKEEFDECHRLAYWEYPMAAALGVIGWCHLQKAIHSPKDDPARITDLEEAAQWYLRAAKTLPEDEEQHSEFLQKHLECLCFLERPLADTLPVCQRIRKAVDQALDIWSMPPFGAALKVILDQVKDFEDKYNQEIADGKCTLDSVGELPTIKRPPQGPRVPVELRDA